MPQSQTIAEGRYVTTQIITFPDMGMPADQWEWGKTWVIDIPVKIGDKIRVDDPIVTVECEKATMDVPSTLNGTVRDILVRIGDVVTNEMPILKLVTAGGGEETASIPVEARKLSSTVLINMAL